MAGLTVMTVGSHSHQCPLLFCRQQQQAELDGGMGRDAAFETSQVTLPQVNTPELGLHDKSQYHNQY